MKLAAHITFFHSKLRLKYLKRVVDNLLEIEENIHIYIYTNKKLALYAENSNIKIKLFNYRKFLFSRFSKKSFLNQLGIKWLIHPFYLAWENRDLIETIVEEYDVQIYLEDDIEFKKDNFEYWLKYKQISKLYNYNLGFFRFEVDETRRKLLTDVNWPLTEIIELEGQKFLLNNLNPYCGFWIMDKNELKEFVKSKEWNFDFNGYGIREKSAIGWHGGKMQQYIDTIIPLIENRNSFITPVTSAVHHLPNNYIGKSNYCTIEFPITFINLK